MPPPTPIDIGLERLSVVIAWIGAVALIALVLVTMTGVIWRYFLNDPIGGISDIGVVILVVVVASSVAYGAVKDAHVNADLISHLVMPRLRSVADSVMRVLVFTTTALAVYALVRHACGFEKACITGDLNIPHWPLYYALAAAMGCYCIHALVQLARKIRPAQDTD